ncbi:MAG: TRAP transporter fused permease subunit [Deltaproteobacteria bacterium]|nr:TRAP transporter fused permease subunit [Deltaproteobacteria bacterium]MBW2135967.1 TRAP transporter fused permease subunit [Deltaproteobacteria bacterium]
MAVTKVGEGWKERGIRSKLALVVAILWALYTLAYLTNVFFYLGVVIYSITHRAISSGLICSLVFLLFPFKKGTPRGKLPWYDVIPILVVIAGCAYIAVNANQLVAEGRLITNTYEMALATLLFASVVEAIRRTIGSILAVIIVSSFFYAVYSNHFPGFLRSTGFSYPIILGWMYLSAEGLWGMILGIVSTIVAGFIIFGGFLRALGASDFFNDLALAAAGHLRGGAAKASVIASTFFGTISGSTAANVATTGQITIPLMKKTGYERNYAGAVEATASLGGMFMPPVMGATAFLIAEFLQVTYWSVCVAAFLPAMAYYGTLLAQVDLEAAKIGLKGLPRESLPSVRKTLLRGWQYLLPFALLLFLLGGLRYSAQTSIMYTLGALIIVSSFRKESRLTLRKLITALEESAKGMLPIIPLCTGIGVLVGSIEITGAGTKFTSELLNMSGGNLGILLLLTGLAAFILGMGMTAVSVYLLTVVLLAPALIKAGVEPIAAHMFLFYFGCLSFITPPVCVDAYIAAGIAGGEPFKTGFRAMRLGFAAYLVPWAFIFNPGILMIGSFEEVLSTFFFVTLGAMTMGVVFEGYLMARIYAWERFLLTACSLLLFIPNFNTRIVGLLGEGVFLLIQILRAKKMSGYIRSGGKTVSR